MVSSRDAADVTDAETENQTGSKCYISIRNNINSLFNNVCASLESIHESGIYLAFSLHAAWVWPQRRLGGWERLLRVASSASRGLLRHDRRVTGRQCNL
jgi:hypothetical protein